MKTEELTAKIKALEDQLALGINEIIGEVQCKDVDVYFYEVRGKTGLVELIRPSIRISL